MTESLIDFSKIGFSFDNTYSNLPKKFLVKQTPIPVKFPKLIILNQNLSKDLDLNFENILIDKASADLLKGSQIDFVSELIGESFKISNPKTKSSCGCGISFSF